MTCSSCRLAYVLTALLPWLPVLAACQPAAQQAVYTVDTYNPAADPVADLAQTVQRAQAEHKRIIVQVGGDWCQFCHRLDKFIRETPSVATMLHDHFLMMKVSFNRGENENEEFLSQFPPVAGYPHWYVLDANGTLLHSIDTSTIESRSGYSTEKILQLLDDWKV